MMHTLWSQVAPQVVIMTITGTTNDNKFGIMTTLSVHGSVQLVLASCTPILAASLYKLDLLKTNWLQAR